METYPFTTHFAVVTEEYDYEKVTKRPEEEAVAAQRMDLNLEIK